MIYAHNDTCKYLFYYMQKSNYKIIKIKIKKETSTY